MNERLRRDAETVVRWAIQSVTPETAVERVLSGRRFPGRVYLTAVGKAAWKMAETAVNCLEQPVEAGIVVTKYGHVPGPIPGVRCFEAGHPVPDENSFAATRAVLQMTENLKRTDTVLLLLSGGGSALFEQPRIPPAQVEDITRQLLAAGADIVEMNTVRKRLSDVKGGRFALHCAPARVHTIALSDVLGDFPDMIASGPAVPDSSTCARALETADKYALKLSDKARSCLGEETPKTLENASVDIIGSVRELLRAAEVRCRELGYTPVILTDRLDCEAREAGRFLGDILRTHQGEGKLAFLAGGETVVRLTGKGLGGRNQELALAAADRIAGLKAALISAGSDGTDGPTDAAGGYVDGDTLAELEKQKLSLSKVLADNDSYHALQAVGGLIFTGPTGTNVNDITVALTGE